MIAEHRARGRADDDLVRLRQSLLTRRQVRCLADDRRLRCRSHNIETRPHRTLGLVLMGRAGAPVYPRPNAVRGRARSHLSQRAVGGRRLRWTGFADLRGTAHGAVSIGLEMSSTEYVWAKLPDILPNVLRGNSVAQQGTHHVDPGRRYWTTHPSPRGEIYDRRKTSFTTSQAGTDVTHSEAGTRGRQSRYRYPVRDGGDRRPLYQFRSTGEL